MDVDKGQSNNGYNQIQHNKTPTGPPINGIFQVVVIISTVAAELVSSYNPRRINSLSSAINGTGTYGFVFNSSTLPDGVLYGIIISFPFQYSLAYFY